ncbi:Maturation and nuclear export of 40S ribosomal subunits interacting protein [Spiromyces aspiralis]|uniref:Maturation and nuclear export of 40S ribosomal subunits interacting protein n=1 Tax=Spiromyces aspiralis TaxID=68401 RepID=A0ACC1HFI4_9FUNG|nr:Maturation and nuclear export of 40S ribosomal subunits interacting protein [Spiromyces aspiralis]
MSSTKRKLSTVKKEETETRVSQVREWERRVKESAVNANDLVLIMKEAKSGTPEVAFAAIHSLSRVFSQFFDQDRMRKPRGPSATDLEVEREKLDLELKVRSWLRDIYSEYVDLLFTLLGAQEPAMQISALKLLLLLVQKESAFQGRASDGGYNFENILYARVVDAVLRVPNASELLTRTLVDSYLNEYDDLRYHFYHNVVKSVSDAHSMARRKDRNKAGRSAPPDQSVDAQKSNLYQIMRNIRKLPELNYKPSLFWVTVPEGASRKGDVFNGVAHRKAFADAWLTLMRMPLTTEMYKQILLTLHKRILPYMPEPQLLMDFLTDSYNSGGPVSLLALNGLFTLITEHNLNYPEFYAKFYALFDRNLMHVKYRARFFRLAQIFLSSTHLPAYLVAAFIKKMARLALSAPPSAIAIVIPFIYNLLKSHPTCMVLIHRIDDDDSASSLGGSDAATDGAGYADPFDEDEKDPAKCRAIESSLWEIETLQNHFYANISTLSKVFNEPFRRPPYDLEDFMDHTYATLFESDTCRRIKKAPPLAATAPTTLFRPGDALQDIVDFS